MHGVLVPSAAHTLVAGVHEGLVGSVVEFAAELELELCAHVYSVELQRGAESARQLGQGCAAVVLRGLAEVGG